jgi:hypothetical protein
MFKTNATGSVGNEYVNQDLPGTPGTVLDADDRNITQEELVNAVESSAQTLDPSGVDDNQLARAILSIGCAAQTGAEFGSANDYRVVHSRVGLVFPLDLALMDGFILVFKVTNTNTGASTFEYLGVDAKPLTYRNGDPLVGDELIAGDTVWVAYNLSDDRWEFLISSTLATGALTGLTTAQPPTILLAGTPTVPDISIQNLGIKEAMIAIGAITSSKMGNSAVTLPILSNAGTVSLNVRKRIFRAWGVFTVSGGVVTPVNYFGITSVTRTGTGEYLVTITTALSNANYGVDGNHVSNISTGPESLQDGITTWGKTTTQFKLETFDGSGHSNNGGTEFFVFGEE